MSSGQNAPSSSSEQLPTVRVSRASTESSPGTHHESPIDGGNVDGRTRMFGRSRRGPAKQGDQRKKNTEATNYVHDSRPPDYARTAWAWKHKAHPDGDLKWHLKWTSNCFAGGRVLIIDYVSSEHMHEYSRMVNNNKRHIIILAQEFTNLDSLKRFYEDSRKRNHAALRLIHVQNAPWARNFLLRKFNIDHPSDLVGMKDFARWARYETPRTRNGRPFPNGRSWRPQIDPWRSVSRTAFGLDYLKTYQSRPVTVRETLNSPDSLSSPVMHLNAYEDSRSPHGFDVSIQRTSVYIQRRLGQLENIVPEVGVECPYQQDNSDACSKCEGAVGDEYDGLAGSKPSFAHDWQTHGPTKIDVSDLENGNTIIFFDQSASRKLEDCLVGPREEYENRWRRLTFYLKKEEVLEDRHLAVHCTNLIIGDIYQALGKKWTDFLNAATDHVSILEDKIYENPADESRAPELWMNSAAWLKVDKIMWIHQDLIKEMQGHLRELAEDTDDEDTNNRGTFEEDWLPGTSTEFDKLGHAVLEDLTQPTNNLNDLMYKSVGIRDSRQSLQLGLSMWRLSWISFIFLPLTFIVSFFGMNVDALEHFPSIGWYFLASVLMLLLVIGLWYGVKHSLQRKRQTAYQRGTYEQLFHELGREYPALWSDRGAVASVRPVAWSTRLKWRLLRTWFAPEITIDRRLGSSIDDETELGAWMRLKWHLLKRWLPEVATYTQIPEDETDVEAAQPMNVGDSSPLSQPTTSGNQRSQTTALQELAKFSTPVLIAGSEPSAAHSAEAFGLRPLNIKRISLGRRSSGSDERSASRGSSGMMVEEHNLSDSETDAEHDAPGGVGNSEREGVPIEQSTEALRRGVHEGNS